MGDYNKKSWPKTDDVYTIGIMTPHYGSEKIRYYSIYISICNHCEIILGIGKKD